MLCFMAATPLAGGSDMARRRAPIHVGTAGWSVARSVAPGSRPELSGLERYAEYFAAVEINSTFYRLPRATTLERWRDSTPRAFRFCVKLPQSITHEAGLVGVRAELSAFCELVSVLGAKLGPLLVQLPPSLDFDARRAGRFLAQLAHFHAGAVAVEPRHPSWFCEAANRLLLEHGAARVAADPASCPAAREVGGARGCVYYRWHGSPQMYFSSYDGELLSSLAEELVILAKQRRTRAVYCIFDNTTLGAAGVNALTLRELIQTR
jgi:uncharacterized protein YecE (DUF72 family)